MNSPYQQNLHQFFQQFKAFHYKKRETILFTNDTPAGVYYIQSGYIRSYLLSKEGKELTVTLLKPFDIFPMHWVINNRLTSHYYESLTDVIVFRSPKESFLHHLKTNPEVFFYTTSMILMRLTDASTRMETAILGNAGAKVAGMLTFLAEHLGHTNGQEILIDIPLTHKDLSSLIGLTRETVSLEMEKLEKQKVILQKNHQLVIRDIKSLKKSSSTE